MFGLFKKKTKEEKLLDLYKILSPYPEVKKFLDKQIDLVLSFGKLKQKLKNKISI